MVNNIVKFFFGRGFVKKWGVKVVVQRVGIGEVEDRC